MSIVVNGVTRFFGSTRAVWQMSMSVPPGTVTGLVGSNGAGKTTLLLILAALLAPDTGSIRVAGIDPVVQPREVHQAVGWMPDSFGTWDSLTCTEILTTFAAAQLMDREAGEKRAAQMLTTVHLDQMANTPARVLSRGQKQRLGLARALLHRPKVLLLDEPAAGMDPRSRTDLRVLLRDLASDGVTVLVSSHILAELEQMVDGVVFMAHGRAIPQDDQDARADQADPAVGAPAPTDVVPPAVRPQPVQHRWRMRALDTARLAAWAADAPVGARPSDDGSVQLTVPDDATAATVLRAALDAGVEVISFAPSTGALEETYLAMEGERR